VVEESHFSLYQFSEKPLPAWTAKVFPAFACPPASILYVLQDMVISTTQSCHLEFFPGIPFKSNSTKHSTVILLWRLHQPLPLTASYIKSFTIWQPLMWMKKWKRLRQSN